MSRERDDRTRASHQLDPHDILSQQLDLPKGNQRQPVWTPERTYDLRNSEIRLLAAAGAFRVIDAQDFRANDQWHGDLDHLRREGLIELTPRVLDGRRTDIVSLSDKGKELLERNQRNVPLEARQAFYSGLVKPRELAHDVRLYRAYATAVARLSARGATVRRVVLDFELKRDYQRFLQANNRTHRRSSGRPDRSPGEIHAWATSHYLPIVDEHVQFPDVRVEYDGTDGRPGREDLEVTTDDYSGRQMAAKRASGFTMHGSSSGRIGGSKRSHSSPFDPRTAEKAMR